MIVWFEIEPLLNELTKRGRIREKEKGGWGEEEERVEEEGGGRKWNNRTIDDYAYLEKRNTHLRYEDIN